MNAGIVAHRQPGVGNVTLPTPTTHLALSYPDKAVLADNVIDGVGGVRTNLYVMGRGQTSPIEGVFGGAHINQVVIAPPPATGNVSGGGDLYISASDIEYLPGGRGVLYQSARLYKNGLGGITGHSRDPEVIVEGFGQLTFHNGQLYYFAAANDLGAGRIERGLFALVAGHSVPVRIVQTDLATDPFPYPSVLAEGLTSTSVGLLWGGGNSSTGYELQGAQGLIKSINPGPNSSIQSEFWDAGGTVYFVADDGVHGPELWKTNGASGGTSLVADINPGAGGASITAISDSINGKFFFAADDGVHGTELWVTDGTPSGTRMVVDLNAGPADGMRRLGPGSEVQMVVYGNSLLFSGNNGSTGYELYQTDGTAAGTVLVADINPGPASSSPKGFQRAGSLLLFGAADGRFGTVPALYSISVIPNSPPVRNHGIHDQLALTNSSYRYDLPATLFSDVDIAAGDTLRYSAAKSDGSPLPSWLSFNATSLSFSGMAPNSELGVTYSLTVSVRDRGNESSSATFNLTVASNTVNYAPYLNVPTQDVTITAGMFVNFQTAYQSFLDPNPGDNLTITASLVDGSPLPAWLEVSSYSFSPGQGFFFANAPANAEDIYVRVVATDPFGLTDSDDFWVHVYTPPQRPAASIVYVDTNYFQYPFGPNDPDNEGPATQFGHDAFSDLQDAIDHVADGGTVVIRSGFYGQSGYEGGEGQSGTISNYGKRITLAPGTGDMGEGFATVEIYGDLSLDAFATVQLDVSRYTPTNSANHYDRIFVNGLIILDHPILQLRGNGTNLGLNGSSETSYKLLTSIVYGATESTIVGTFANLSNNTTISLPNALLSLGYEFIDQRGNTTSTVALTELLLLDQNTINENRSGLSLIGNLRATLPGTGPTSLQLIPGMGDNSAFDVLGSVLASHSAFDFETKDTYTVFVRASRVGGSTFVASFQILVNDLPEVQSVVVGDGALQRSMVKSLTMTFDGAMEIQDLNAGAFTVRKRGLGGGVVNTIAVASVVNGRTAVTLTFVGQFVDPGGSLSDGNYELVAKSSSISRNGLAMDGDKNGSPGGDFLFGRDANDQAVATDKFFRFFGDADGDGDVDTLDAAKFNLAFSSKLQNALTYLFDYDGDGSVLANDRASFNARRSIAKLRFF